MRGAENRDEASPGSESRSTALEDSFIEIGRGRRMYVDADDERGKRLLRGKKSFNPDSLELWERALSLGDWDVVVDVGSNYGEMLLGVELPAGAKVIAYEPSSAVLPFLRRSIGEAGLAMDLRESAVSDFVGTADFAIDTERSGRSSISDGAADAPSRIRVVTVPVTTIDHDLADEELTTICIKVDVEGHDLEVIEGARETLARAGEWAVMFESLHIPTAQLSAIADRYPLYLADGRTGELVRIPVGSPALVQELLDSDWLQPQDALLVSESLLPRLTESAQPQLDPVQRLRIQLEEQLKQATRSIAEREHSLRDLERAFPITERALRDMESIVHGLENSRSWRSTAWMRGLAAWIRRGR